MLVRRNYREFTQISNASRQLGSDPAFYEVSYLYEQKIGISQENAALLSQFLKKYDMQKSDEAMHANIYFIMILRICACQYAR